MKKKVDLEKFSKEELEEIVASCFDRTTFAQKLGYSSFNGQISKKIGALIDYHQLNIDHFDPSKRVRERRLYPKIKKNCPVCQKEFETEQDHPKEKITCSYSCSNVHFANIRHTEEANKKTSEALVKYYETHDLPPYNGEARKRRVEFDKECPVCKNNFKTFREDQIYCSNKCVATVRSQAPEYKEKLSALAKQRVADGTHSGWVSRSKMKPSFPEKVVMEILDELGIVVEREYKCGKWFIDFAEMSHKIALEIDGKQHELPERKASDEQKDAFLVQDGWKVHRIKWKKLTKEVRAELKQKLIEILIGV